MSDVPQLQNTVHLNNPALSPPQRSLATADHDGKTRTTCPQSHQRSTVSATCACASLPLLPQTSTPRRQASLSIIFGAGFGLTNTAFSCGIKKKRQEQRHTSWAPSRLSAGDWSASAPSLASFLYARSRYMRGDCACSGPRMRTPPPTWNTFLFHKISCLHERNQTSCGVKKN